MSLKEFEDRLDEMLAKATVGRKDAPKGIVAQSICQGKEEVIKEIQQLLREFQQEDQIKGETTE